LKALTHGKDLHGKCYWKLQGAMAANEENAGREEVKPSVVSREDDEEDEGGHDTITSLAGKALLDK